MGFFSSAMKDQYTRQYSDRVLFQRFWARLLPFKKSIFLMATFIILRTITELVNPFFVKYVSDHINLPSRNSFMIFGAGFLYLLFSYLNWFCFSSERKALGNFMPFFLEDLRMDLFDALQKQDMSFYDGQLSGKLNSIVTNDTLDFSNIARLISDTVGNLVISVFTFVILLILNPPLAGIAFLAVPVLLGLMYSLRNLSKKVSGRYRRSIGNVNAAMVESIEGIHVSKSFGQESHISSKFETINQEYFKNWFRLTSVTHFWRPMLNTITSIVLCLVIYVGSQKVLDQNLTAGTMVLFILYLQNFFRPIMILARFFPDLNIGMAAFERILRVLDAKPRVQQIPPLHPVSDLSGDIDFSHVDFAYEEDKWIFQDFNLHINQGENLAIVGHTGAGKTSIGSLLARFYEFQQGTITIGGVDIRSVTLDSYRRHLAKVEQNVYLFPGTIEENIRYGREDASTEDLQKAIEIVQADEFIQNMPLGLQSFVGEAGKELSMGQQQLVSFARAILMDPDLLILDEATASVDAYTEAMIQAGLENILQNRTAIIIAHRLSTVIKADRIIVMDHGRIIEEGTHKSLLAANGKYAQLYHTYFEHQSPKE